VHARSNAWWLGTLSVLVALMPLSFSVPWHAKALPAILLLMAGLQLLFSSTATRNSYRAAWPVVFVCALGVGYTALNILGHGLGWDAFDLPSHILLYMATAAVFSTPLRMRWVWLGFSLTSIVLGVVCIEQHFVLRIDRAFGLNGGDWGAIEFAMVMLVLSLIAWLQLLYAGGHWLRQIIHGLGAVLGIYGAILTQSRGPLLAFVPVLALLLMIYGRRTQRWVPALLLFTAIVGGGAFAADSVHDVSAPAMAAAAAAAAVAVAAESHPTVKPLSHARGVVPSAKSSVASPLPAPHINSPQTSVFVQRFSDVGSEMASYNAKTDAKGAVRERLEMWRTARRAFMNHPLVGVGIDQFGAFTRQQVKEGRANSAIAKYDHPHNEYLEAAATGGVPGLLVILLIFAVPLVYFIRHALHALDSEIIPACVGVALVSMYALCGLTDNVFYRAMPHSLYFFLVLGLAILLGGRKSSMEVVPLA
jgi:O-antigen ligase